MADADFPARFHALTGFAAYRWQARLYEALTGGCPPHALELPTGLGKTSVITIWLAARISGAAVPKRLVYVVDRRAVVDQATAEAEKIARALDGLIAGPEGEAIRRQLKLAPRKPESGETWLPISTLRGQHADNRRWFEDPGSAAIVVGTVDMIGSRLLFQGYGVSPKMRPVHAGLLGADSLIVLDEAHLVPPFEAMVRQVSAMAARDVGPAPEALSRRCGF